MQRVVCGWDRLRKEDGVGELRVLLLQHFELPFYLRPGLAHLLCDDSEVASVHLEERDQRLDVALSPKRMFWLVLGRLFLLSFPIVSPQLDGIDEGRKDGDR